MTLIELRKLAEAFGREAENDGYKDRPMSDNTHEAKTMLLEAIEALQAENERLQKLFLKDVRIKELGLTPNLHASFEGGPVRLMAECYADFFRSSESPNYIEMQLCSEDGLELIATLQRKLGKTPHQLRQEAEAERDALAAKLATVEADAERGRFMIKNGCWHRGEEQTHLAVLVPQGSDLSCVATRRDAVDAAIDAAKGGQPTVLKPFTPCVCHDDTAKLYCKNKGKCSHFVAQEGRPA